MADIGRHPARYEFVTWAVEPGDVIVHHPLTIHGAPGNLSNDARRRALATRWLGDDARWSDNRPHFLRQIRRAAPDFPYPQLAEGAPLDDPLFPKLWAADALSGRTRPRR